MAHYGSLGNHRFTADVPDVRGADVYGSEDERIGNIEDVIFDHETMEIRFVVIGNLSDSDPDAGASGDLEFSAGELFPERISDVFSDTAPGAHKVTLRPRSVRRAEEAAAGVALLKARWDAFAEHLRRHRIEVQSRWAQCAQDGEKASGAA